MDLNQWRKVVKAKNRAEKFYKKIGGKTSKFKKAIVRGRAAKKTGLQLSGLGAAATTSTAAASGFILFIKKLLKKINFAALFKKKIPTNTGVMSPDDLNIQSKNDSANSNTNSGQTSDGSDGNDSGEEQTKKTFKEKVKAFFKKHKKKIIGIGITVVIIIVAVGAYNRYQKTKKRSLAGIKAARTRARNRRKTPTLKGAPIKALPAKRTTKAIAGVRKTGSKISNANRLKAMHVKAKQLRKQHPKTKYSTLLKKAAKMI